MLNNKIFRTENLHKFTENMSSSSRSDKKARLDSRELSTPTREPSTSHSLPKKVYEVWGKLVLLQDLLQAGVVDIKGGDGKLAYCFFQVVDKIVR